MINKTIIFLTTILLLGSCSVKKKFGKLFEEGDTKQKTFKVEIPFEYRFGLIIIKERIIRSKQFRLSREHSSIGDN